MALLSSSKCRYSLVMKLLMIFTLLFGQMAWAKSSMKTGEYYRYIDASGMLVIDNDIPPERVRNGYEVINKNGRVIRQVDAVASGEELAKDKAKRQKMAEAEAQRQAQENYDLSLLRRYSFVSDINAERARKIKEMEVNVSILKGNLNSVRAELTIEFESAAKIERSGGKPPQALNDRIAALEEKITTTEDMINKQKAARDITSLEYQRAIDRFTELQVMRGRRP